MMKHRRWKPWRWCVGSALSTVALARVAAAQSCAMCASSFGPNEPVTRAFNSSILFLMAAPYSLFGTAAIVIYVLHRRAAARRLRLIVSAPERTARAAGTTEPMEV